MCSQIRGSVPLSAPKRTAVSAVTLRLPATISFNRFVDMPMRRAASAWLIPDGFRYSSSKTSPGCVGGRRHRARSAPASTRFAAVEVFDGDIECVSVVEPEDDPVPVAYADAVEPRTVVL